ncbi:hypothetical protein K458DRAFT_420801 [Lentithecium fluviatile CBS 122367]|uniref:Uncharacterized protein n=1 Tax=Lentithecium fluviatile CBS 122367 TaxID=1168545 RepID=A0A6G1ISU2_9PLEO|nr:hypothetical protein K458DRAFT_420801 [Lentithecium fluviatile CBS 122367]
MSGPYRFTQEPARSPLDRRPQNPLPTAGQPVSFKTNVNRMKTKKWVEAKKNAYDGDDWGEYDEYDEYGAEQAPPQPAPPPGPRGYGQRFEQPPRSFTEPQRQGAPQPGRRNSFEAGDENRAFSSSMGPPAQDYPQQPYGAEHAHPTLRQASGAESDVSDTPQHRRDFSPTAMPHPLQTRISPGPGSATGSPNTQYPPRKSSIGQADSPSAMSPSALSPRERAPSNPTKPLPFIRPADIYRRVEEERQRERASIDSSRPSLDSLTREQGAPQGLQERPSSDNLGRSPEAGKSLQPLETVAERKSEYLADSKSHPSLPPVEGVSEFGSDFWSSGSQQQQAPAPAYAPADQGFRTVVDQAFARTDEQRSIPPTPITNDSSVSRSNTGSTSGISPIMSRVSSSALKARNQAAIDGSTPVIAEETSETYTPVSWPTSAMLGGPHQIARKPSPSHSRNVSSSSVPRSGLATPSPGESPARSPAIAPQKHVPEPESAQLSTLSPISPDAMEGGLHGPSPTYATREADIASAMESGPGMAAPDLCAAEHESQNAFLETHHAQSPINDALPRSRSESPSKGRVQELAGKFGEMSSSRRGSTQSNTSRNSVQSWERSQDNSRPPSPTKSSSPTKEAPNARPAAQREASFRPKLPGQWESYATNAATPSEHGRELGGEKPQTPEGVSSPLGDVDLTPTTAKHPVSTTDPSASASDPISALKAAGAAVGEAVMASVGRRASQGEQERREYSHGDVLPRPLQLAREPSAVSTIPPTPPAKDSPEHQDLPPPPPLKETSMSQQSPSASQRTMDRPAMVPQMSTDASADDQESDRLRKEIVARLSAAAPETNQNSLQPNGAPINRESSIFPSEYESYWADGDRASPRPSHDISRGVQHADLNVETTPTATKPPTDAPKPAILTRFSWEEQGSQSQAPGEQTAVSTAAPALESVKEDEKLSSPAIEQAAKEHRDLSMGAFSEPYFGPAHSVASNIPEPASNVDITTRAPTPPPDSAKPITSPTRTDDREELSPVSGLHVVNSAINPEAVDIPPRLSREVSPISQPTHSSQEVPGAAHEKTLPEPSSEPAPRPAAHKDHIATSPVSDKPLGPKEIATIKSPAERIANYNSTRDYWAHFDHGLNDWVSTIVNANPELATESYPQARPALAHSATSRHKTHPSLSLFGKHHGSSSQQASQSNTSPSQATPMPTSAPMHGGGGRTASSQMHLPKGKDLLHTAGMLGGKGMTGAKGLFAKGKSRFKSDKVDK